MKRGAPHELKEGQRHRVSGPMFSGSGPDAPLVLNLQLIYEEVESGLKGMQTCERILKYLRHKTPTRFNLWRFDVLCAPGYREHAWQEIRECDILLLSARGDRGLPEQIYTIAQDWVAMDRYTPLALVLLTSRVSVNTAMRLGTLKESAEWAGVKVYWALGNHHQPDCVLPVQALQTTFIAPSLSKDDARTIAP